MSIKDFKGLRLAAAGMNPMDLKRGIDIAVTLVVEDIGRRAKKVQSSEVIDSSAQSPRKAMSHSRGRYFANPAP